MHDNQLDISPDVVRTLVERQFPQWRSLPVRHVAATGTVNAIFRIGDLYAARFPLKAGDVDVVRRSLEAEAKAAAELAGRTRFQTPEPVALGEPGAGYPLPWSVQTWLPGTVATDADPGDSLGAQATLQGQLLVDVDVNFRLKMEHFEAALDHPPCGIARIGGHAWMTTAERDAGRRGHSRLDRHPLMESQGLVHGGELVEPIRT